MLRTKEILKKNKKILENNRKKQNENNGDEGEWEDIDEHEKDVFDKDGYYDVPTNQQEAISQNDEHLLKMIQKKEKTGILKN